jgi:hypothetical protein
VGRAAGIYPGTGFILVGVYSSRAIAAVRRFALWICAPQIAASLQVDRCSELPAISSHQDSSSGRRVARSVHLRASLMVALWEVVVRGALVLGLYRVVESLWTVILVGDVYPIPGEASGRETMILYKERIFPKAIIFSSPLSPSATPALSNIERAGAIN